MYTGKTTGHRQLQENDLRGAVSEENALPYTNNRAG